MDPRKSSEPTPDEHETTPEMRDLAATLVRNLAYDQHAMDPATLDREQALGDSLQAILQHTEQPAP